MSIAIKKILDNKEILEEVTKRAFDVVDTDKSGKIELKELKEILIQISLDFMIEPPNDEDIGKIMAVLDTDKSGTIELEEFQVLIHDILKAMLKKQG